MIEVRWRARWGDLFARRLRWVLLLLALPAGAAYFAFLGITGIIRQDAELLVWLIVGVLTLWVLMLGATWARNRDYWGRETVVTADATGLHLATSAYRVTILWEGLASATLRRRAVELRWTDPRESVWIPVRAFVSPAQVDDFVEFARSCAADARAM